MRKSLLGLRLIFPILQGRQQTFTRLLPLSILP
jgi:hypothetical protein